MSDFSIKYIRKRRLRRINLRVTSPQQAVVSYPWLTPKFEAEHFVSSKMHWIEKQVAQLKKRAEAQIISPDSGFQTRYHKIHLLPTANSVAKFDLKKKELFAWYPEKDGYRSEEFQNQLKHIIAEVYRLEAKHYLPIRTAELAEEHGFTFSKLTVRKAKTRWGSCSQSDSISLNIQLMKLDDDLIDYVILHELCHTVEKNHSSNFWDLLEKVCPGSKKLDKKINAYSTSL